MRGFVYAVECGDRIKIGYSENPEKRFSKIASDSPFPCQMMGCWPATVADELAVHDKFNSTRIRGEWFAATEELRAFISDHVVRPEPPVGKRFIVKDEDSPIAAWRKSRRMCQQKLAEELGIDQATVSRIERGAAQPSGPVARLLERIMSAPAEDAEHAA